MKYKACGHYLIIKLQKVADEKKSAGGIVFATNSDVKKREQVGMSIAEVVDIGQNCWAGFTDHDSEWHPWCKIGDKVMIAQYGGQVFPVPESLSQEEKEELALYRLVKDDDILARVE